MPVQVQTSMMAGGLDLTTAPIAMPSGRAIAAVNYEPDVAGYTSHNGFERFDGHDRPSDSDDPTEISARRAAIGVVPGTGAVRGVWVFAGDVYAFRDYDGSTAKMYKATGGGWVAQTFGYELLFELGTDEFLEGEYVTGTSTATGFIERVILRAGAWDGTAEGFLVLNSLTGTFVDGDVLVSSSGGGATAVGTTVALTLPAGGKYDFTNHNFYGAARTPSMYFANGVGTAFEWTGSAASPIRTGTATGVATSVSYLLAYNGDFILASDGSTIILSATFDAPTFIEHFQNHLFLAFSTGSLINSSIGEPLEYLTTTGAGEISFGETFTGLLTAASTSLMLFGQNRVSYMTGTDQGTFELHETSTSSGAKAYTAKMMDMPMFMDDGGVRKMDATSSFGDWRMGSVTQLIEPLMRRKIADGVHPAASLRVKAMDQYKLYWDDGSGITVFIGRKYPEAIPFKLPIAPYCACSGEVDVGHGDRLFVGAEDGYVYEFNRGTSFDGAEIQSYIRLPFTAAGSPSQETRWMKATFEISSPDDITLGVAFDVDYARGLGGTQVDNAVDAGSPIISTDLYSEIDWTQPVAGRLEFHLSGIGPNIAATLIHSSAVAEPHTISAQTYNFSRRGLKR